MNQQAATNSPSLIELARALIADGWPVLLAFREARDRLDMLQERALPADDRVPNQPE